MEEIILDKINWSAPEYKHEEKNIDFLWAIGLVAIVGCGLAIWRNNYIFGIFLLVSGASLILFSIRHPREVNFSIETSGLTMGKDKYAWKDVKGFQIKKEEDYAVLLVEINKYVLPVYTIPLSEDLINEVKENLIKVIPTKELEESKSMKFMENLGF